MIRTAGHFSYRIVTGRKSARKRLACQLPVFPSAFDEPEGEQLVEVGDRLVSAGGSPAGDPLQRATGTGRYGFEGPAQPVGQEVPGKDRASLRGRQFPHFADEFDDVTGVRDQVALAAQQFVDAAWRGHWSPDRELP